MYLLFHLEHLPMAVKEHEVFIANSLHETKDETKGYIYFHVTIGEYEFIASMDYTISYNTQEYQGDYWTPPFTEYTFRGLSIDYGSYEIVGGKTDLDEFSKHDQCSLKCGIKHTVMRESKTVEENPFDFFDIEEA
ncbi:hypothetical protein [Flammeovirga aprica]|uniref:Uncharacterized protein n=1 Tax=Flammeovirga aprica JL-4 TaxID=694437 RepID=A0A7X9RXN3_9BACT|nr:hypothetical protein [Flammeovirga aprica]NME70567.1 hypothetical protein [Flammeovirga aprica JL-4]